MFYVIAAVFALASVAVFDHTSFLWAIEVAASNAMVLVLAAWWSRDLIVAGRADPRPTA